MEGDGSQLLTTTSLPERLPDRKAFARLVPPAADALEIGPFCSPMLAGPRVRYFDVLDRSGLVKRAVHLKKPTGRIPERIHYVHPQGDLKVVDARFDAVLSSHVIEHQPDLVAHLRAVERVLRPGGCYFALVPDRRYCFDHFIAPSTIADVIDAHVCQRRVHTLRSRIEHVALTTHNDARRHWEGDHGRPKLSLERLGRTIEQHRRDPTVYVDVHAWYFEPDTFEELIGLLGALELTQLRVLRIYPTLPGTNEFWAILERRVDARDEEPPTPRERAGTSIDRWNRRLRKLGRDPLRFLADSRFSVARTVGRYLARER